MANLNYSDQANVYALVDGLSQKMGDALAWQQLPATLNGYVLLLSRLDNQRRLFCV
jgi:hypothetical protein